MPRTSASENLDITNFTVGGMLRAGIAVRRLLRGAQSLEEAADRIVRFLYDNCIDPQRGSRTTVLVRFYKTHQYGALPAELQLFADRALDNDEAPKPEMRCLTLLATVGDQPDWMSRRASRSHQVIPLPSADIVRRAPMIAGLIEELGFDIESVVLGNTPAERPGDAKTYDVFHVKEAFGNPSIPAQDEFVVPYGVTSVLGFGGLLRSGELFAIILFARAPIPEASASRFRAIALDVRSALYALNEANTWADAPEG
ncbi:MAG: hypothetical protein M3Z05_23685 [Gemmatimonadota bacterium]|nr:hypothetical protein [Gemmatimonadota bacterium]